jgi:hypothetical protein
LFGGEDVKVNFYTSAIRVQHSLAADCPI